MLRRRFAALAVLLVPLGALPASAAAPTLVVYPFAVDGSAPAALGAKLADQIAAEVAALGGIRVVYGNPSTKPAGYRAAARAAGADNYFSGSIIPIGTSYSAIEQLVSTQSGTVNWSVTIHFRTLDEVNGQGARVRDVLLRNAAPPAAAAVAAPGPSRVTPAPAPVAGYAVLPVTGSARRRDRQYALRAIVETLQQRGFTAVTVTSSAAIDPAADGAAVCSRTDARTLIAGTLDTTSVAEPGSAPQTTAHVALRTYDCRAQALRAQATVVNHIAPVANDAIRGAVEDAISAFPAPS